MQLRRKNIKNQKRTQEKRQIKKENKKLKLKIPEKLSNLMKITRNNLKRKEINLRHNEEIK